MNIKLFVAVFVAGLQYTVPKTSPTPPVAERLKVLKWQLQEEIKEAQMPFSITPPADDYDVLDPPADKAMRGGGLRARFPRITPINEKRRKTKTTAKNWETCVPKTNQVRSEGNVVSDTIDNTRGGHANSSENLQGVPQRMKQLKRQAKKWAKHLKKYGSPLEIFYRRGSQQAMSAEEINRRHKLHCIDLLRPILLGMKKNITPTIFHGKHQVVERLLQLLSYGGETQSGDEIRAILLQINNLQIRLFQWDVAAIKKLFNFIMPGQRHSFKFLKSGVKKLLLDVWKMDLKNTDELIKQSRMFRPPCVPGSQGSTMSSKGTMYTMPQKPKSTCSPKDKKCLLYDSESDDD